MVCILASSYLNAKRYAFSQMWDDSEWFYPTDISELYSKSNFHVLVTPTAHNIPEIYFNELYELAKRRGRINRG